jgi:hypothetical protein
LLPGIALHLVAEIGGELYAAVAPELRQDVVCQPAFEPLGFRLSGTEYETIDARFGDDDDSLRSPHGVTDSDPVYSLISIQRAKGLAFVS